MSSEAEVELGRVQAELRHHLAVEEQFWRQKARVKWLQHGDQNSRYFYSMIKQQRFQAAIHRIRDSSRNWITDDNGIRKEAVNFFLICFRLILLQSISCFMSFLT